MTDHVVTVPKHRWLDWLAEGDLPGDQPSGRAYSFFVGYRQPTIEPGERLYVVAFGRVRGFAPVKSVILSHCGYYIVREGGARAVTIPERVTGFQGFRRRWWELEDELPFGNWRTEGVPSVLVGRMR